MNSEIDMRKQIVSLMDLTLLGDNDTKGDIAKICSKATNVLGDVAAVCIYKEWITVAKKQLPNNIKIATVINFPSGKCSLDEVLAETTLALKFGADEIDLVIDYQDYIKNSQSIASCQMISAVKKICGSKALKVIIESGELEKSKLIKKATKDAIDNGADFIKTSTGKVTIGATIDATKCMLETIKESGKKVGFKASGGIRSYSQAVEFMQLATKIFSKEYVCAKSFRFGVSGLLDSLLENNLGDDNAY